MLYSTASLIIIILGLTVVFNKKIINTILLSFVLSIVLFGVLMFNKLYFLAVIVALIDVYTKVYILIFYINKKEIYRTKNFNRKTKKRKILEVGVVTFFLSIGLVLLKGNQNKISGINISGQINETVLLGLIVTLFSVAGYIIKSKRWN